MSWAELLAAAERIRNTAVAAEPAVASLPLAGLGWATVEGDRAMRELDAVLPGGPAGEAGRSEARWSEAPRDDLLGARAWLRLGDDGDPAAIVVLEPDTEGRLAAALARWGEGVAAIYLGTQSTSTTVGHARGGPLGRGLLVRGAPAWGPHVIVLGEDAATDGGEVIGADVARAGGPS